MSVAMIQRQCCKSRDGLAYKVCPACATGVLDDDLRRTATLIHKSLRDRLVFSEGAQAALKLTDHGALSRTTNWQQEAPGHSNRAYKKGYHTTPARWDVDMEYRKSLMSVWMDHSYVAALQKERGDRRNTRCVGRAISGKSASPRSMTRRERHSLQAHLLGRRSVTPC